MVPLAVHKKKHHPAKRHKHVSLSFPEIKWFRIAAINTVALLMYHRWKWHSIIVVCAFLKEIFYCNKFCFVAMHGIVDDGDTRLWGGLHFHKNWLSSHCDNPPPLWLAKLALFTPGGHGGLAKRPSDKLKCLFQHFSSEKETNPDKLCVFNTNLLTISLFKAQTFPTSHQNLLSENDLF